MGNQLARRTGDSAAIFTGTSRDGAAITKALQEAQKQYHLVSPAAACGRIPEGCGVALSTVAIDVATETYDVGGGRRGLSKTALDRIAGAAGISWNPHLSRRLDDASDPRYVMFHAVGSYRSFDGSELLITGTKEMDLRDGSAQVEALWDRYRAAKARGNARSPEGQIREMRLHILAHAETKAKLRAIRSIGLQTAYPAAELQKPFVVARLMWTGESDDPELRRAFALKQADAMLGGSRALFGDTAAPALAPAPSAPMAPPPVGSVPLDRDDVVEMPHEPPSPAPSAAPAPARGPAPGRGNANSGGAPTVNFGSARGMPITDINDRELAQRSSGQGSDY